MWRGVGWEGREVGDGRDDGRGGVVVVVVVVVVVCGVEFEDCNDSC